MKHKFTNDYSSLCHPSILKALENLGEEQNVAYGLDKHSLQAEQYIKDIFESSKGQVYFVAGGTMANLLFISYALRPYEAVIALETGHINVHETGAVEATGHKIITAKGRDGKLYPEDICNILRVYKDEHMVKPKMVYISDSTEIGTIYSRKELVDLYKICQENDLLFFIDGARLGSALTSKENDVEPGLLGKVCDAFYVGGAKNGLMLGEALVINNPELQKDFRYHIKNRGAMISKGFLLGAIFEEAFKDGLYFDIARKTNEVADYLKEQLKAVNMNILPSPTNQVFASLDKKFAKELIKEYGLELWEEKDDEMVVRFVVSFTTKKEDVDELISFIKSRL